MVVPFLQQNIQYRASLKGPIFIFLALRDFFRKICFLQRVPFKFLMFCDRIDVEESERVPGAIIRSNFWVFQVL